MYVYNVPLMAAGSMSLLMATTDTINTCNFLNIIMPWNVSHHSMHVSGAIVNMSARCFFNTQ